MWIEILQTYVGPAGLFVKGLKYDLPESIVKQIAVKDKTIWRKCDPVRLGDGMFPHRARVPQSNTDKPERPPVHAGKG